MKSFMYDFGNNLVIVDIAVIKMVFTVQQKVPGGPIAWPPRSPDLTPMDFFY